MERAFYAGPLATARNFRGTVFRRAGGSRHPYKMVKAAGVDLALPAPYQTVAARMNGIMDEMEAILAKHGK